jgi:hypothetical protein
VIALRRGGAAETIIGLEGDRPTGVFYEEQAAAALIAAVERFESEAPRIGAEACRANAQRFSAARFRDEFSRFVAEKLREWQARR